LLLTSRLYHPYCIVLFALVEAKADIMAGVLYKVKIGCWRTKSFGTEYQL